MSTFTKRIDSSIRDIFDWNDGSWNASNTLERIGNAFSEPNVISGVSLRFTSVTIPQGATISAAKVTFRAINTRTSQAINFKIWGVAADNTGEMTISPIDTARTRTHTSASATWSGTVTWTSGSDYDTADFASVIQEIVNRSGWSSGNALAISIEDNGNPSSTYLNPRCYDFDSATAALLTVTYTSSSPSLSPSLSPSSSPSASDGISPSASVSLSPSLSASLSISLSPSISVSKSPSLSPSTSTSRSASPSLPPPPFGLRVAKTGENALTATDPSKFKFHSDYGTLKYFHKGTIQVTVKSNSTDLEVRGNASYAHNLGYFPFVEVYVKDPLGTYSYCPALMTGASTFYKAGYTIDQNNINFFVDNSGYPGFSSNQTYTFIYFIFKNNLNL